MHNIADADERTLRVERAARIAVVVGAAGRVVFGLVLHPPSRFVYSDMAGYVERAQSLVHGAPLTRFDAFFPPGTHLLLALAMRIAGLGGADVAWAAMSVAVPVVAWRATTEWAGRRAGAIAAILASAWPLYVVYGGYFLSETPSVLLLLATLWALGHLRRPGAGTRLAAAAGALAGCALVVRPQLALNLLVAGAFVLVARSRAGAASRRIVVVAVAAAVVPVVACVALDSRAAGKPTGLGENAGLNFFQGHCAVNTVTTSRPGVGLLTFASPVVVQAHRGDDWSFPTHLAWEQSYFVRRGLDCIARDGVGHTAVLARNVADLGATSVPWPPSNERNLRRFVIPANWSLTLVVPALAIAAMHRRRQWGAERVTFLVLQLGAVIPTAVIFYGDPRFRLPHDVFAFALAGVAIDARLAHARQLRSAVRQRTATVVAAALALGSLVGAGCADPERVTTIAASRRDAIDPVLPVGQTLTTSWGNRVTVDAFESPARGVSSTSLPVVAAHVVACASPTAEAGTGASPALFSLETSRGPVGPVSGGRRPELATVELQPGECATGWVTFVLARGARPASVVFQSSSLAKWRVP